MKILIIGDYTRELADWANKNYSPCILLTNDNFNDFTNSINQNFYTSIQDISADYFVEALGLADRIIYHPPTVWSDTSCKKITETHLAYYGVFQFVKNVENFNITDIINPEEDFGNLLGLVDQRKTDQKQFWVAGCSCPGGYELKNINDRYGQLVADHYKKPVSFLSRSQASIAWASDQILRSDIRKGDTILFHLTELFRYEIYRNNNLMSLSISNLRKSSKIRKILDLLRYGEPKYNLKKIDEQTYLDNIDVNDLDILEQIIIDDTRLSDAVRSIYQVVNYCKKIQVNLLIVNSHWEFKMMMIPGNNNFEEKLYALLGKYLLSLNYCYVGDPIDFTDDEFHPGPKTHQDWAKKVIKDIDKRGWKI